MKCKKCGAEIESKLLYCPNCGEPIQLVPDYNVFEEELLSKVVEDKKKAKEDKFATGVYNTVEKEEPHVSSPKPSAKASVFWGMKRYWLKIVVFLAIVIMGICIIFPFIGSHTYDNLMNKAISAEADQKYAKALGYYREAYELEEDSFEAIYGLGRMYFNVKDYNNALELFNKALKQQPNNKKLYSYILESYDALNDTDSIYKLSESAPNDDIYQLISEYIVLPPTFSYAGGKYNEDIFLDFKTTNDNLVFYTLNGKNPTISGKLYKKSIKLTEGTTEVKAVVQTKDGEYSQIASQTYTIVYEKPDLPEVSPKGGTFTEKTMITIKVPDGAKAYYTWDGTNPAENGIPYTEPFPVIQGSSVLSVVIVDSKGNVSQVYRGEYNY